MAELKVNLDIQRSRFNLAFTETFYGEITVLFGPSGCGKTSTLRAIAGLDRHPGLITFGEEPIQASNVCLAAHLRGFALIFQKPNLFQHMNVRQNILLSATRDPDEYIDDFGVHNLLDSPIHQLSGGELRRVELVRALACQPRVFLLDEPLNGLDRQTKAAFCRLIRQAQRKTKIPMIYVTHDTDEVARVADRVLVMKNGKIVEQKQIGNTFLNDGSEHSWETVLTGEKGKIIDSHIMQVKTKLGLFWVPKPNTNLVDLRLQIKANDVSICLSAPQDSSILNIFRGKVLDIQDFQGQVLIKAQVGEGQLLAEITQFSFQRLKLRQNSDIFLQVKSVALLV